LTIYLALLTCRGDLAKELIIIYIIKDKSPLPSLSIPEPIFDQFEYIDLGILTPGNFNLVRNLPETLLEPGRVTRMDPENPCCWRLASGAVGELDGKLRFPFELSATDHPLAASYLPDTAETNKCYPSPLDRAFPVNLIKQCVATDKVRIPPKRDSRQGARGSFGPFYGFHGQYTESTVPQRNILGYWWKWVPPWNVVWILLSA
jgi:hypothetical protein